METAAISYRVADFLKQHAPFHAVPDADLLTVARGGRVRFFEPNEYILWQGEPHKPHVYVIQQGTVSLWDEASGRGELRDVRGAGDMLGLERYNGARSCLCSARSESDVVVYGFAAEDFEACVLKHSHAVEYVTAEGRVTPDYQASPGQREPHRVFLHDVVGRQPVPSCKPLDSVSHAAHELVTSGAGAIAVIDTGREIRGILTMEAIVAWVAAGGGDAAQPVAHLLDRTPVAIAPDASVADTVLAMAAAGEDALVMTTDGTVAGPVEAIVTARGLVPVFGDQPAVVVRDTRRATSIDALAELMRRSRAIAFEYLTGSGSVEWLTRYIRTVDVAIVERAVALTGSGGIRGCWCFCGAAGRGESLTAQAPQLALVLPDGQDQPSAQQAFGRVLEALSATGYVPAAGLGFPPGFYVDSVHAWSERFSAWIRNPIIEQAYQARSLFDLCPVVGSRELWRAVDATVVESIDSAFVRVTANDCLASLPPLTFFEDAVVDSGGEHAAIFRLEQNALRPLVDAARVFGLAAKSSLGTSTLDRLSVARRLVPEQEAVFREAADTLRIVLWQQGRIGIGQGTDGAELPPALLSRSDRQVLKSGFRSILRLLELAGDPKWLEPQ